MSQESPAQGQPGQSSAPHPVHTANEPAAPALSTMNGGEGSAPPASKKQAGRQANEQKKVSKKGDDIARTMAALEVS